MTDKPALDQIIDAAEAGESYTFTKDGKPVAILIGYVEYEQLKAALDRLQFLQRFAQELDL